MMGRSCKIALSRGPDRERRRRKLIHFGVLKPTFPPQTKHFSHIFTSDTKSHLLKSSHLFFLQQNAPHPPHPTPPPCHGAAVPQRQQPSAVSVCSAAAAAAADALRLYRNNQRIKGAESKPPSKIFHGQTPSGGA